VSIPYVTNASPGLADFRLDPRGSHCPVRLVKVNYCVIIQPSIMTGFEDVNVSYVNFNECEVY